jgi:hypothetical protein
VRGVEARVRLRGVRANVLYLHGKREHQSARRTSSLHAHTARSPGPCKAAGLLLDSS